MKVRESWTLLTTICKTSVVSVYFFIIIYSSDYISFYLKYGGGNKDSGRRLSTTKVPGRTSTHVLAGTCRVDEYCLGCGWEREWGDTKQSGPEIGL